MVYRYLTLNAALLALGPTADDVADTLDDGGWSGYPGDAGACPIAQYLMDVVPDVWSAAVSDCAASVFTTDRRQIETVMPPGPAAFVTRFDDGAYPYLIENTPDE